MHSKITAALAATLILAGIGPAGAQGANQAGSPSGQAGSNSVYPTTSPSANQVHNPLTNPSAAGTQMPWKGYGATSGATAAHPVGTDDTGASATLDKRGSVTPGAGRELYSGSASPPAARAATAGQARERLRQLGYTRVTELRQVGQSEWRAVARKNNRDVQVILSADGTVRGER